MGRGRCVFRWLKWIWSKYDLSQMFAVSSDVMWADHYCWVASIRNVMVSEVARSAPACEIRSYICIFLFKEIPGIISCIIFLNKWFATKVMFRNKIYASQEYPDQVNTRNVATVSFVVNYVVAKYSNFRWLQSGRM